MLKQLSGVCVVFLLFADGAHAQTAVQIPRVTRAPAIQDFIDNTPRERELVLSEFRQREPGDGDPGSQQTIAYLSYDDSNLYVVFVCHDSTPANTRANLARREGFSGDDFVGVALDTFRDGRHAYYVASNPLGVQLDGLLTEGQGDDYNFDMLWHTEGRLLPSGGYVVWFALPFKSLRFSESIRQTWGIGLTRSITRTNEVLWWPHVTQRIEGRVQQFAVLEGLENVSPGRNVQLVPYGAYSGARFLDGPGAIFKTSNDVRVGLDAKIVIRGAVTLDLTGNPDFSQVESDEPQVTINQRFEVFFPEKRPFFVENAAYFETPETLFFSRRIADPHAGIRLTGKVGRWAVGGLLMDDRAGGGRLFPPRPGRAAIGVLRLQRELPGQSTVGFFGSATRVSGTTNDVGSVDTRLKIGSNWTVTSQAILTAFRKPGMSESTYGTGVKAEVQSIGRHFFYQTTYTDRSPNLQTTIGFLPRTDIRDLVTYLFYNWKPAGRPLQAFGPFQQLRVNWNRKGEVQDWLSESAFSFTWPRDTFIQLAGVQQHELFQGLGFRSHRVELNYRTQWLSWMSISGSFSSGTGINFSPSQRIDPFLASSRNHALSVTFRPSARLRWDQALIGARLTTRPAPVRTVFENLLLRSKINYQFSRDWSLRLIIDYDTVEPNPELVALDRVRRIRTDILLTRLVNPWTAIYLGYTDTYANLALDPALQGTLRRIAGPTNSVGRQVFVKTSYLLRF